MGIAKIILIVMMVLVVFFLGVMLGSALIAFDDNQERAARISRRLHKVAVIAVFLLLVAIILITNLMIIG